MEGRRRLVLLWLVTIAAGLGLRLAGAGFVLRDGAVHFVPDSDAWYHVLGAERIARDWPHAAWRDPAIGWPEGAELLWPPLFDELIATTARAASGGGVPSTRTLELTAAALPVALGLAALPVAALLASSLAGMATELAVLAALSLALLPAHIAFSALGRPDQHVAEALLCAVVLLGFGWSIDPSSTARRRRGPALLALALALAFWNWMGSALYLLLLGALTASWRLLAPAVDPAGQRMARALALGAGGGALLLALSVALLGAPGALGSPRLSGVGGVHVAFLGATGLLGRGALGR